MMIDANNATIKKLSNSSVRGMPIAHARSTVNGTTISDVCIHRSSVSAMLKFVLSCVATTIDIGSQLRIGKMIAPTKMGESPAMFSKFWMLSVANCVLKAISVVDSTTVSIATGKARLGIKAAKLSESSSTGRCSASPPQLVNPAPIRLIASPTAPEGCLSLALSAGADF